MYTLINYKVFFFLEFYNDSFKVFPTFINLSTLIEQDFQAFFPNKKAPYSIKEQGAFYFFVGKNWLQPLRI